MSPFLILSTMLTHSPFSHLALNYHPKIPFTFPCLNEMKYFEWYYLRGRPLCPLADISPLRDSLISLTDIPDKAGGVCGRK